MPLSRPMPSIGARCHELRVRDGSRQWRLVYRTDPDAILVVGLFSKTTQKTPKQILDRCRMRLRRYEGESP